MRQYELTYMISDEVRETDLNKVTGKIAGLINGLGGKVTKEDIWGRRKLCYTIKKQDFATYVTVYFSLPADKARELEREIRLETTIIRQLMMVKDYGDQTITLTQDEIAGTEEIEALIGHKSFEAIEGETEQSRDLMAVREEKTEEVEEEAKEEKIETEDVAEEKVEEPKEEAKPVKKEKIAKEKAVVEEKEEVKPVRKVAKKKEPADEAERLSKLNEELDDILKDEL